MNYSLSAGHNDIAKCLICTFHYSRRMPGNVVYCFTWHEEGGLLGDMGEPVAACCFSIPPTRWSEQVLELSRLVRKENKSEIQLSQFISKAIKYIRAKRRFDLIVSFADFTQGHHGGIYQASNFCFHGRRERSCDGMIVNGNFIPGRTLNANYGTRSFDKLKAIMPDVDIKPHFDEGKFLYWLPLNGGGQKEGLAFGIAEKQL